jgi:hypothetical protein
MAEQSLSAKVREIWYSLSEHERRNCRFGIFPMEKVWTAEAEGYSVGEVQFQLMKMAEMHIRI